MDHDWIQLIKETLFTFLAVSDNGKLFKLLTKISSFLFKNTHYSCLLYTNSSVNILFLAIFTDFMGFPRSSDGKESTCIAGDLGSIPRLGSAPGGRHGHALQYSCLENPQGQRSLVGYNPWGHKESEETE